MGAAGEVRIVKVFVSSPADVAPERGRVQAVAAKLSREYEGLVRFETVLWEEHFYLASRSFQPQIPEAAACDVVVSIFWTRIGVELPGDFPLMPSGQPYPSGSAYELLTALEASKRRGVPDLYVFRKTADAALPTTDSARRRQAQIQLDTLEAFWSTWFKSDDGQFKAAYHTFTGTDAFERQIEQLLRQWLEREGLLGPRLTWPKEKGAPFRGLAPFEAEHAAVFFGRNRAIDDARRRLMAAAEQGTPFLLIVGASGTGKSSLARAGLIPRLTSLGVVPSVDIWRVTRMKPGEDPDGPLASLATGLLVALPELAEGDFPSASMLVDHLRRGGAAAAQPVVRALARVAEAARSQSGAERMLRSALVLLVDQLDELFAQAVTAGERSAFAECLKQLVATGQVWCVATLRADLYELLLKEPALEATKAAGAGFDLGPPGAGELEEMVRAPAAAAGLVFEHDAAKGRLDERLLADAKTADSLPLLQFTLRQLYERRLETDAEVRLTHAAYEALGGLEGAIAAEAERAVAGLGHETLDGLPRLLRRLAEPARDGKSLTLREALRVDAVTESTLVEALLGARIMVARTDPAGRPTLRLAHDAVFASWPRAAAAAQASREFYRVRAEVEDALERWQQHGRPKDRLVQAGVPLAEAERLVHDFARELPAELVAYVGLSRSRARARQRLVAASAVFFFFLAIGASAAGIYAYRAQQQAIAAEQRAIAERDNATRNFALARGTADSLVLDIAQGLQDVEGLRAESVRKILETAKATFEQLAISAPDDLKLQQSRARMLLVFGDTYRRLGDLTAAGKAYRESHRILERLANSDPGNAEWQRDFAFSYERVGDILLAAERHQGDALEAQRQSLAIRERLANANPDDFNDQRGLSGSFLKIGDLLKVERNLPEALTAYRNSLAIAERLAKIDPGNAVWQSDAAVRYSRIADVLQAQGNLSDALKEHRNSLAVIQQLAKADPATTVFQRDLSVSHRDVGDVLRRQGNLSEALQAYRDSLVVIEQLARTDPGNAAWQDDIAAAYERMGEVLAAQGDLPGALNALVNNRAVRERLARADTGRTDLQYSLAISHSKVGEVLKRQDNLPQALQAHDDARAILEDAVKAHPGNTAVQHGLASSYERIGNLLAAQGRLPEALTAYRQAIAVMERVPRFDPKKNADWQRDHMLFFGRVGVALQQQGNLPEALAAVRHSLEIAEGLVRADPHNAVSQHAAGVARAMVGTVLTAQGAFEEALVSLRDSLAILGPLAASDGANAGWQADLKGAIGQLGSLAYHFVLARKFALALESAESAVVAAPDLIWLQGNRAHALMFLGRTDEARALYLKYRGESVQPGKPWVTAIAEDFAELRQAGLAVPLMEEVERQFGTGK